MKKYWLAAPAAAVLTLLLWRGPETTPQRAAAADDEPKPVKPVNLDCNTKADEDDPHVSSNGTTLYYTSNAKKKLDLTVSKRASASAKWGAGKSIGDAYGAYVK